MKRQVTPLHVTWRFILKVQHAPVNIGPLELLAYQNPKNKNDKGYICNIFAPLWITVVGVVICFPYSLPVTVGSMNWR
jgi:hypothetical protein